MYIPFKNFGKLGFVFHILAWTPPDCLLKHSSILQARYSFAEDDLIVPSLSCLLADYHHDWQSAQ